MHFVKVHERYDLICLMDLASSLLLRIESVGIVKFARGLERVLPHVGGCSLSLLDKMDFVLFHILVIVISINLIRV